MIRAPAHLSEPMRKWIHQLQRDWELEARHIRIAVLAAECWDWLERIRVEMEGQPLTVTDRYNMPKIHPLLIEARQQKKLFTQMIRELGLDLADAEVPRIPKIGGPLYAEKKTAG